VGSQNDIIRDNVANDRVDRAVALQYFRRVQQAGVKEVLHILKKFWVWNHFVIVNDELYSDIFDLGLLLVPRIVVAKSLTTFSQLAYEHIVGDSLC
jgi:hypothetical protein